MAFTIFCCKNNSIHYLEIMENTLQNKIEPQSEKDSTVEVIQRVGSRFLFIISIVPILFLFLISYYIITHLEIFKISKLSSEPFDAAAALFSGFTLIFLIYGVWMQREELKDTKSLLREQKKISDAQEAALRKQNEATERQMFETTFFKLLDVINKASKDATLNKLENQIISYMAQNGELYVDDFPVNDYERILFLDCNNLEKQLLIYHNKIKPLSSDNGYDYDLGLKLNTTISEIRGYSQSYLILIDSLFNYIKENSFKKNQIYFDILKSNMTYDAKKIIYYASICTVYNHITPDMVIKCGINGSYAIQDGSYSFFREFLRENNLIF